MKIEETSKAVFEKSITTEKGETLTVTAEIVNASPQKKIVQELLSELFSEIMSEF